MPLVSTRIEIEALPEVVRAKFLDFGSLPKYHHGHFKSIAPKVEGQLLKEGEPLMVELVGMKFNPTLLENSPSVFSWRGSLAPIFSGDHFFHFSPGQSPGTTTFIHEENFYGLLAFLIGENWLANLLGYRQQIQSKFSEFNWHLKSFCERQE